MTTNVPAGLESVATYGAAALKPGASDGTGSDLARCGARRVLLITDAAMAATGHRSMCLTFTHPGGDRCQPRGHSVPRTGELHAPPPSAARRPVDPRSALAAATPGCGPLSRSSPPPRAVNEDDNTGIRDGSLSLS